MSGLTNSTSRFVLDRCMRLVSACMLLGLFASAEAQDNPAVVGRWSDVINTRYQSVHMILLPTGKVLYWSWNESLYPQIWDPATETDSPAAVAPYLVFCAGHSGLANGNVLVTGGHIADRVGLEHASIYNPFTNTWTQVADMNAGRWYPTNTTLPNGDVLTLAGNIDHTTGANTLPQIWQTATGSWRDLPGAEEILPMYPRIHVAPNGMPFISGPNKVTSYLDMSGSGIWRTVGYTSTGYHDYGTSVMYDIGKVLILGGGDPPINTAEIIDLNSPSPSWQLVAPMNSARRNLNGTLLPNGKVLVTGGSSGPGFDNKNTPVFAAEMWDPVTKTWAVMASNAVYRGYHSNSLLLPDARVISSGGDGGGANLEIYSPPYLFQGPRPTITAAPNAVTYGQSFTLNTPDAASISQVTLLRLGSVTHAFDMDQRILRPAFSQARRRAEYHSSERSEPVPSRVLHAVHLELYRSTFCCGDHADRTGDDERPQRSECSHSDGGLSGADQPELDGWVEQRGRLPDRAVDRRRQLQRDRPGGAERDQLCQHRADGRNDVPLPGTGV